MRDLVIAPGRPRFPAPPPPSSPEQRVYRFELPWCPGVNHLYATNFRTKRRFPTERYETWRRQALDILGMTTVGLTLPEEQLAVHFRFYPPKGRRAWDVDGRFKAPLDALVAHFAPDLDDRAERIAVVEGEAMAYDGCARVEIAVERFADWRARSDTQAVWAQA